MNNELMHWLNLYLLNAGAKTVPVREISKQLNELLITVADTGYENNSITSVSTADATFTDRLGRPPHKYEFFEGVPGGGDSFSFSGNVPEDGYYPV